MPVLGWFSSKCPLGTQEKTWTEVRLRWIANQLGIETLLNAEVILPTADFFPESFVGDEASAEVLFGRMCEYMKVDRHRVQLRFLDDVQLPNAAGIFQQDGGTIVSVRRSGLEDVTSLAATMIHELSHERLLGTGLLSPEIPDHEWVTDLLPVFLGTGIFLANATVFAKNERAGHVSWWSMTRQGYAPSRVFGYAFALFAFFRGESEPPWARYLRPDAANPMKTGLRYLQRGGHSLFHPDSIDAWPSPLCAAQAIKSLHDHAAGARLASLWDVAEQQIATPEVVCAVQRCLIDRDPDVQVQAAFTLGSLGGHAEAAIPQLIDALWHGGVFTRQAAAKALGDIASRPDLVVPELIVFLRDATSSEAVQHAAEALAAFGTRATEAVPHILHKLVPALAVCDHTQAWLLVYAIHAIDPDCRSILRRRLKHDPDLWLLAREIFSEVETGARPDAT
jgi:hypothetical protein